ncbi:DUF6702 family protein [Pelagicoccus albus]|uniref:Uncharacterized protein n=1 Tax=Pelagicoccus albus TaxID=415222 RepID=A0A7X1E9Y0_9BACT|nr:DUF6702 family protein [Pelagicoccus albus]MBC2607836.1 hypothetical protein [Pelagicoccus albus]
MKRLSIVLAALAWLSASDLLAHRKPEAFTSITRNENSGTVEIVHTLHAHDVEPIIDRILNDKGQSLETLEGRARMAIYVEKRFGIREATTDKPLSLTLVGAEVSGEHLYVYQEYEGYLPDSFSIRSDILRDVYSKQSNLVSIKTETIRLTLFFTGKDKWKAVR